MIIIPNDTQPEVSQSIYNRYISNMPPWFGNQHQNLDALLAGFVSIMDVYYQQYQYLILQQRIATATEENLDLISQDYLGNLLPRKSHENDDTYRARILATVLRPKATRMAMYNALLQLTGFPPIIYEGWLLADGMALNEPNYYGLNINSQLGSGLSPYTCIIVVFLPSYQGMGNFPALNEPTLAGLNDSWYVGSFDFVQKVVSESDVLNLIEITKVLGTLPHVIFEYVAST